MENIILIDKPKGITSFDVIRRLRQKLGIRKIGHAGTLDPNATGLLIIGVGEGTKRLKEYAALPKTYVMDVLLGVQTDSGDITGRILQEKPVINISRRAVNRTLRTMVGIVPLPAPTFSALKYKGKPRYAYARKGIEIPVKIRDMEIRSLKLLNAAKKDGRIVLKIELECGKGTYARSVAEEIGRRFGIPATLSDLRRTKTGQFKVSAALKLL